MIHGLSVDRGDEDTVLEEPNILNHIPNIIKFLELTCEKDLNPTVDYIRLSLTLITDIHSFSKNIFPDVVNYTNT